MNIASKGKLDPAPPLSSFLHIAFVGELFGPFIDLPKETQQRALEFVYYVDSGSAKVANAIEACKKRK